MQQDEPRNNAMTDMELHQKLSGELQKIFDEQARIALGVGDYQSSSRAAAAAAAAKVAETLMKLDIHKPAMK